LVHKIIGNIFIFISKDFFIQLNNKIIETIRDENELVN